MQSLGNLIGTIFLIFNYLNYLICIYHENEKTFGYILNLIDITCGTTNMMKGYWHSHISYFNVDNIYLFIVIELLQLAYSNRSQLNRFIARLKKHYVT
jgi:hypothetical protein